MDNYQSKFILISGVVPKSASADSTGLVINNINTYKTGPFLRIPSRKESHPDFFYDNNNIGFEKFLEFTINEILTELKNVTASNKELAKEIKIASKAMLDSVQIQTELTLSINSLIEERKNKKNN